MARAVEEIEFDPAAASAVLEWMARLASAGDGWINLLPGVPDEEVGEETRSVFAAIFGKALPPTSMCTWVPSPREGRGRPEQTVGIMHPKGRHAVAQLASDGIEIPTGWRIGQDLARRGLIVHPTLSAPHSSVLAWSLRAGTALSVVPLTGRWKARVYLPKEP